MVLTEAILVWSGVMDLGGAVLVVAGLEALLFLVGLGGLVLVVRRFRKERRAGAVEGARGRPLPDAPTDGGEVRPV